MTRLAKIDAAARFAITRLRDGRQPIVVRWQTTNRCTARCRYCEIWRNPGPELSTAEARAMLTGFHRLGMRRLCLSGGEPLLRDDIEELIRFARRLGVSVEMNTNGVLVDGHLSSLAGLSLIKISLDGDRGLHDHIRGCAIYDRILANAEAARREGVRFGFTMTLIRENTAIAAVDHVLAVARRFGTFAAFQPVVPTTPWGSGDMDELAPEPARMRVVFQHLLAVKRREPRLIRNSLAGLRHVLDWPRFTRRSCVAGRIFVVVESSGDLYACERTPYPAGTVFPNVRAGVEQAFSRLVSPSCDGCGFCGATELALLWDLDLSAWREVVTVVGLGRERGAR